MSNITSNPSTGKPFPAPSLFDPPPAAGYPYRASSKEKGGTSQQAAAEIEPSARTICQQVLRLYLHAPDGLSADEAANLLGYGILTCRPRVTELHKQGHLIKTDVRRKNRSGKSAVVYMAVEVQR